jgi:hypothetical protein
VKTLKLDPKTEADWREFLKFRSEWDLILAHFNYNYYENGDGEIKHPTSFQKRRVTFGKCP